MEFSTLTTILLIAIPIIFAITVHEVAHGWTARLLGDNTAAAMGRLTLNPVRHMDLLGTVLVPFILVLTGNSPFGWAKPVPVNWQNLQRPKRDMALVAAAGPLANLLMLLLWGLVMKFTLVFGADDMLWTRGIVFMAEAGILINSILMILNLFPVPPLDGSRIVTALLPPGLARSYVRLEPFGLIIVLVLFFTGYLGKWLTPIVVYFNTFIHSLLFRS